MLTAVKFHYMLHNISDDGLGEPLLTEL